MKANAAAGGAPRRAPAPKRFNMNALTPWLFMAPFLLLFTLLIVIPVLNSFYLSFTYFNVLESPQWIGLSNFKRLFLEDDLFIKSLKNTLVFGLSTGPGGFILALLLAWLINLTPSRARLWYTFVYYIPSMLSGIAIGTIWRGLVFSGDRLGVLNSLLMRTGVISEPYQWLANVDSIMPVLITVALWSAMGVGFLSMRAGILSVPRELYEAGSVDGVENKVQEFWFITLPMIRPQMLFGAVMAVVGSFKMDALAQTMFGFPSPLYAAHMALTHVHDYAFERFEMGYAAAISVVFFAMMYGLNKLAMRLLRSTDL